MSIQSVEEFSQFVSNDPETKKRLEATTLEATTSNMGLISLIVQLGSERGFTFTIDDVNEYYVNEFYKKEKNKITISRTRFSKDLIKILRNDIARTPNNRRLLFSSIPGVEPPDCSKLPYLARLICERLVNEL